MTERPDPDALLQRVLEEEARASRGHLKIFFGACAGVGKTYAMLAAAQAAHAQGLALIIGLVETHGRPETEAMVRDLPRLPLKDVAYRDRVLKEFDLDSALAYGKSRAGTLVLLDELAHSNAPGSRHPKRWQDVQELLGAGIDVWSTMNVQHLESLNDIVSRITGVRVAECVPDRVFDDADEVVVVDLPPDELLARLKAGKVYLPQQAERAAANFFRKGNLLALRELALRRTADRVDGQMLAYRRHSAAQTVWPNRESLLACVGQGEQGEKVVRSCARQAAQMDVPWHAVFVETPGYSRLAPARRQQPLKVLELARELGATVATTSAPDAAQALVRYAREHNLVRLVVGRAPRRWPWHNPLADRIAALAHDLDVLQIGLQPAPREVAAEHDGHVALPSWPWQGYLVAVLACGLTALLSTPLLQVLDLTNIVMLFLLAVVAVALRFGRGPAVMASFVGVGLFDFFFVPPRFSFVVSDVQYLVTFGVMLVVALVVGQLTAGLKIQAQVATEREHRVRSLYEMSRDLSMALLAEQVAQISARFLAGEFGARSTMLVADDAGRLHELADGTAQVDLGVAQWAYDRGESAGHGTGTLPASTCLMLPLKGSTRLRGVLAVQPGAGPLTGPDRRQLLDTCASLLAISLERIHYIDVAQSSTVQIESERLRNSLLSAISHDLRTPLAALVGLVDTLAMTGPPLPETARDIVTSIRKSALRMNAMVNNLLDMARLQAGAVRLNLAWLPLDEVVGGALAACGSMLDGRPVTVRLADDLPLLHLDAVLFERALVNLLENAGKYTPAGTPVDITACQVDGSIHLAIADHGPGLPAGRADAIFEKFERGAREDAIPGVGLGLAICRAIIQAHGGTVSGDNRTDGPGARFTIVLPCGEPPRDTGAASARQEP